VTSAADAAENVPRTSPLRVGAVLGGIVLAAVVIFGFGVMVGKRVAESVPPPASPPVARPAESPAPPPAPAAAVTADRLTFYDRLSGAAPPGPAAQPDARPPARAAADPPAAPAPAEVPVPAAAPVPAPAKTAPQPDAGERIKQLAGRGRFAVQVASVTDRTAAEGTATRLKRQGFEVVTVMASIKGRTWYRIRVASFPSQQAATKAAGLFRSGYGLNAIAVHE